MTIRHTHTERDPEAVIRHLAFFDLLPEEHKPANIRQTGPRTYEYDYVEGHLARSIDEVEAVYSSSVRFLWGTGYVRVPPSGVKDYARYVSEILQRLALSESIPFASVSCLLWAVEELPRLANDMHVPATGIHGDLTLENVLLTDEGRVVFIDPGFSRGLEAIEMDEAKLLQSLSLKWDLINGSHGNPTLEPPFSVRPVHVALLLTHVIRLLAHRERHSDTVCRNVLQSALAVCPILLAKGTV